VTETGKAVILAAQKLIHAKEKDNLPRATEVALEKELKQAVYKHEAAKK
jgi:hypothetical protein